MPTPSLLDKVEAVFEHQLTSFEHAVASQIAALERYAARMYRFLRHMFVQILRFIWVVITLTLYFLAPAYVFSFGHELVAQGRNLWTKIAGIVIAVLAAVLLLFMLWGFIAYFGTRRTPDEHAKPKTRRSLVGVALFDATIILLVYASPWYLPGYQFASPLFRWTDALLRHNF